ncbi:hypothetical protein MPSEU_001057000 [Mayamaea pseudoterrestris]|nr:hypothetical protein MPSEU_001057000 [Mayamaea pseudoterrestris]
MSSIEWLENETHVEFIQKLTSWEWWLSVNSSLVSNILSLREAHLHETLTAMKQSSVRMLDIGPLPRLNSQSMERSFSIFCQALGCMRRITVLFYDTKDFEMNERHVSILRSMPHVESIRLSIRKIDEATRMELVAALTNHSSLERMCLTLPVKYYPMILPALHTIQSLTKVVLEKWYLLEVISSPEAARAVADLLNMGHTNPLLKLELNFLKFETPEFQQIFCNALTETKINGLDLTGCTFAEPVLLANAIVASNLKDIRFSSLSFVESTIMNFLTLLAEHIHTMTQLEKLDMGFFSKSGRLFYRDPNDPAVVAYKLANDQANVQLVRAVAHCRQLKHLGISFHTYLPELDQALADCVDPLNRGLEEIVVHCKPLGSTDDAQIVSAPLLVQALKKNYTIRSIRFKTVAAFGRSHPQTMDPWTPEFKKSVEIIPQLNKGGRKYLIRDAMDKMAGAKVLGAVSNDLDCLFYHLSRENPMLCDRHKRRKRRRYNMVKRIRALQKSVGGSVKKWWRWATSVVAGKR